MYDRTIVAEGYNKYIMIMKWSSDTHSIVKETKLHFINVSSP